MPVSDLVRSLLAKRGVVSDEDITAFLAPDYEAHTHAPELLNDMSIAADRILQAIERGERIAVYADFDCDGIPGAALMHDFFKKIGYVNVETYIPHRDTEGYGFHLTAIDTLAERGVSVIITIDVGTVAFEAVAHAQGRGIDVIVTDHHEIIGELPTAYAIINPKIGGYPFPHLCGTGVAFKLVCALLIEGKLREIESFVRIPNGWEKWLLDLVAIATVADMVPLLGENRTLVYWGLRVLHKSPRLGIIALCNRLRLRKADITEDDIGFSIAPRINAASRMGSPELALRLLTTTDTAEADECAVQLESLNAKRKTTVAQIVKVARARAHSRYGERDHAIVLGDTAWKPALLGLAANSILEGECRLVCLWGRDGQGNLKGSCRTDGSVSLVDVFSAARDVFEECGGHACSGGFSVSHDKIHLLPDAIAKIVAGLPVPETDAESAAHDLVITIREISSSFAGDVSRLAPFGIGNPKPIFRLSRTVILAVRRFGKESNHVELQLADRDSAMRVRAFQFFKVPSDFTHTPQVGSEAAVIATLERDTFRGQDAIALRLVDVLPSG